LQQQEHDKATHFYELALSTGRDLSPEDAALAEANIGNICQL